MGVHEQQEGYSKERKTVIRDVQCSFLRERGRMTRTLVGWTCRYKKEDGRMERVGPVHG